MDGLVIGGWGQLTEWTRPRVLADGARCLVHYQDTL